ncbi:HAMP domain-containing protein, partial [Actinoplanes sp. NPDC048791]|uniref:HAMP domain-containing protein n=1 Tax=Actinoplanes sp. NPDC048791 TaxID=3154623 RepID=UPI0034013640
MLAPVRRLIPAIAQLGPQNLGHRIRPGRGRDELRRLGRALDATMDRIAAGYEGQRIFAANASYELRTQLALQRTLIEAGMTEPLSPEQSALLAGQLLASNARNERLIEGLLVLSQADQGLASRTPQSLDRITAGLVDACAPAAADADVKVTADLRPRIVAGDGVLLEPPGPEPAAQRGQVQPSGRHGARHRGSRGRRPDRGEHRAGTTGP